MGNRPDEILFGIRDVDVMRMMGVRGRREGEGLRQSSLEMLILIPEPEAIAGGIVLILYLVLVAS